MLTSIPAVGHYYQQTSHIGSRQKSPLRYRPLTCTDRLISQGEPVRFVFGAQILDCGWRESFVQGNYPDHEASCPHEHLTRPVMIRRGPTQGGLTPDALADTNIRPRAVRERSKLCSNRIRTSNKGTTMAGNYGITHTGDLLISRLKDGTDLGEIWDDAVAALEEFNKNRISIVNLLSYQTTNSADAVYQNLTAPSFEQASEFGVSKSIAPPAEVLLCGFTRKDYDLRTEFTRFFLREADRRQVDAIINTAMASDNQLLTGSVLRRLFDPTRTHNEFGHTVFSLLDGSAPWRSRSSRPVIPCEYFSLPDYWQCRSGQSRYRNGCRYDSG